MPVDPELVSLGAYSNWPGIDAPGHLKIDCGQVKAIAARLEAHLEEMLSADKELKPAPPAAYGTWDAAQQFYPSVQAGHNALVEQHSRFLHATMDMIKKLHRSARVYDETEAELERRIAEVDKRLNVTPTKPFQTTSSSTPNATMPNSLNPEGRD
ncbi:MAG: hypothetical protein ACRDP6_23920 [Actinoallomurus sp.]